VVEYGASGSGVGVGLTLVVIFAVKEFRFSFCRRRGMKLFAEGNYQAALLYLMQAERLWMLRLSKQTMPSRAEDCKNLATVLDLISEAAGLCSLAGSKSLSAPSPSRNKG